jgi:hypothetical protein
MAIPLREKRCYVMLAILYKEGGTHSLRILVLVFIGLVKVDQELRRFELFLPFSPAISAFTVTSVLKM